MGWNDKISNVDQTIFQQPCVQLPVQELLFYLSQKSFFLWCEFFVHIIPPIFSAFLNAKRALVIGFVKTNNPAPIIL